MGSWEDSWRDGWEAGGSWEDRRRTAAVGACFVVLGGPTRLCCYMGREAREREAGAGSWEGRREDWLGREKGRIVGWEMRFGLVFAGFSAVGRLS